MKKLSILASTIAMALMADAAHSAITFTFTEAASGVTIDVSGSVDTTVFTYLRYQYNYNSSVKPDPGEVSIFDPSHAVDVYEMPAYNFWSFGGPGFTYATSTSGAFAIWSNAPLSNYLMVPIGYTSGSALSASAFFSGATLASLEINPVEFSHDLGGNQMVNYVFHSTSSVPEPASWALMIGGFGLIGAAMRRRKSVTRIIFA